MPNDTTNPVAAQTTPTDDSMQQPADTPPSGDQPVSIPGTDVPAETPAEAPMEPAEQTTGDMPAAETPATEEKPMDGGQAA